MRRGGGGERLVETARRCVEESCLPRGVAFVERGRALVVFACREGRRCRTVVVAVSEGSCRVVAERDVEEWVCDLAAVLNGSARRGGSWWRGGARASRGS